jgi:5-methylcytosine-specific restriction endonuclease McrA
MRTPPFLVTVPEDRYFQDDHCANCLEPLPDDEETLFCSAWCAEIASTVRYQRRVFRDGRIEQPDVREAVMIRNAFLLAGGYHSLGRTLTQSTRTEVKVRDGGRCKICGKPGVEIDHIAGSSSDLDNLQLLCTDCHHAKTAQNLRPASPEQSDLLKALFLSRVVPDEPTLLADDDVQWQGAWRGLKTARKKRFVDRLVDLGVDIGGLRTRAEMVLELEDFMDSMADDSGQPEDYDGGFGPDSYFARAMQKKD